MWWQVRNALWFRGAISYLKPVIILLDLSGTMATEWKLKTMKAAAKAFIDTLGENDYVNVIGISINTITSSCFDSGVFKIGNKVNRDKLKYFIERIDADAGGPIRVWRAFNFSATILQQFNTHNFYQVGNATSQKGKNPLSALCKNPTMRNRPICLAGSASAHLNCWGHIVLFSDGNLDEEGEAVLALVESLPSNVMVHAYGIGQQPDMTWIEKIACAGGGVFGAITQQTDVLTQMFGLLNVLAQFKTGSQFWIGDYHAQDYTIAMSMPVYSPGTPGTPVPNPRKFLGVAAIRMSLLGALLSIPRTVPDTQCSFTLSYNAGMQYGEMLKPPEGYFMTPAPEIGRVYESLGLSKTQYLQNRKYMTMNNQMVPEFNRNALLKTMNTRDAAGVVTSGACDSVEACPVRETTEYEGTTTRPAVEGRTVLNPDGKGSVQYSSTSLGEDGINYRRQYLSYGWSPTADLPILAVQTCKGQLVNSDTFNATPTLKAVCGKKCIQHWVINQLLCTCGSATCEDKDGVQRTMEAFNASQPWDWKDDTGKYHPCFVVNDTNAHVSLEAQTGSASEPPSARYPKFFRDGPYYRRRVGTGRRIAYNSGTTVEVTTTHHKTGTVGFKNYYSDWDSTYYFAPDAYPVPGLLQMLGNGPSGGQVRKDAVQDANLTDWVMHTPDLKYWYGTCNGYTRGLLAGQTPLACGATVTRAGDSPSYEQVGPTVPVAGAAGKAGGPLGPAITDVRLTSTLEAAWKAIKETNGEFIGLIRGINFASVNGVLRSYPGLTYAAYGGHKFDPTLQRSYIRAMSHPGRTMVSSPHIGMYSEQTAADKEAVITISRTVSYAENATGTQVTEEEQDPVKIVGVLSVDVEVKAFFEKFRDKFHESNMIGPGSASECFQETTVQQLAIRNEKTMCYILDHNGFVVLSPLYHSIKSNSPHFENAEFFGVSEPVIFQEMITRGVFRQEVQEDAKYGIQHRQWRFNEDVFGTELCPSPGVASRPGGTKPSASDTSVKTCEGSLVKEKLTGQFTFVSVPETNLLFVKVEQYQKHGDVSYCGILTDTCRDVIASSSNVPDDFMKALCDRNSIRDPTWLHPDYVTLKREAANVCKAANVWGVPLETLDLERGKKCPSTSLGMILFAVVAPLAAFCILALIWLYWQRSLNQNISLQGACFAPMVAPAHAKAE